MDISDNGPTKKGLLQNIKRQHFKNECVVHIYQNLYEIRLLLAYIQSVSIILGHRLIEDFMIKNKTIKHNMRKYNITSF